MLVGEIVETAGTGELWNSPMHPYTRALIDAIPHPDGLGRLPEALAGEIPDPARPPTGCRFHPRCPFAFERCTVEVPLVAEIVAGRRVACWLHDPSASGTAVSAAVEAAV